MEAVLAFGAALGGAASGAERADAWLLETVARSVPLEMATYAHYGDDPTPTISTNLLGRAEPRAPTAHEREVMKADPFCRYKLRTGDEHFAPLRFTDVVDMRVFRQTEFFALMVSPSMSHMVQTRLPGEDGFHWTLYVERGGRNFVERDLLFLAFLRPSLVAYESHRALAATVEALRSIQSAAYDDGSLTMREREILDLVAGGATNAVIAERLWITPGTVKKHLDNIYVKLEVGSRTAALARTGRVTVKSAMSDASLPH